MSVKLGILIIALYSINYPVIAAETISNNSASATPTLPERIKALKNIRSELFIEKDNTASINANHNKESAVKTLEATNTQNNLSSNTPTLASVNEKIDEQDKKIDEQVASLEAKLNDLESSLDITKADKEEVFGSISNLQQDIEQMQSAYAREENASGLSENNAKPVYMDDNEPMNSSNYMQELKALENRVNDLYNNSQQTDSLNSKLNSIENTVANQGNTINTLSLTSSSLVNADMLLDKAVNSSKIADNAVDSSKLADNAVTSAKINDGSITNADLSDNAVVTSKIADNAVETSKIADNAVDSSKLADNAVTSANINDSSITNADLSDGAALDNIASEQISSSDHPIIMLLKYAAKSDNTNTEQIYVDNEVIADDTIDGAKIATLSLSSDKIANNTIANDKISSNANISTSKIQDLDTLVTSLQTKINLLEESSRKTVAGSTLVWNGKLTAKPSGYAYANGEVLNSEDYPDLYAAIGQAWGVGDGSTGSNCIEDREYEQYCSFNLPDMRGQSLRGVDDGEGIDSDANSRYAKNGGNTGDMVGTYQDDATAMPNNNFDVTINGGNNSTIDDQHWIDEGNDDAYSTPAGDAIGTLTTGNSYTLDIVGGDNETRMKNVAVYYLISCGANDGLTAPVNLCE